MADILIVDDDAQLRQSFGKLLAAEGHDVRTAASGEAGLEEVRNRPPELVVMDVRMPGMNGLEALAAMQEIQPGLPVIIMTAYSTTETAIQATKLGAYDYVLKPFDVPPLLELMAKALEAGRLRRTKVEMDGSGFVCTDALVGKSQAMQEVYKAIGRAAPTDATVLIRGESGTGKELAARAVYQHSRRADGPFCVINCVAIPETLLESELFGYEKGAFTGAGSRRVGKIEQAHRGTVFLDEIGDMSEPIQAKILRLLQERKIERLGGRAPIPVDVRIIAATNRDLEAAMSQGKFREDLFYRLNVVTIRMPPVRERMEDVPLLAQFFLDRACAEMQTANPGLDKEALDLLQGHPWPGNVREVSNVIQKALIFNRGGRIGREDMAAALGGAAQDAAPDQATEEHMAKWVRQALAAHQDEHVFEALMDRFGALLVREALNLTGGNRSRAARLLGMSRPTLLARIEKYGLKLETKAS